MLRLQYFSPQVLVFVYRSENLYAYLRVWKFLCIDSLLKWFNSLGIWTKPRCFLIEKVMNIFLDSDCSSIVGKICPLFLAKSIVLVNNVKIGGEMV